MIAHIQGQITEITPTYTVIDCSGVGYHINISLNTFSEISGKKEAKLYTHLAIREDAQVLYGFSYRDERALFLHLISVSGVGGSTAMIMLSSLQADEIIEAIAIQDTDVLKSIKGIGNKTAERIIVDLKDKISKLETSEGNKINSIDNTIKQEALSALVMLGFNKKATEKALNKILKLEEKPSSVEELVKKALKLL